MASRLLSALRRRASFANVVSLLALFIALGGASYAAIAIPRNSIGSAQLKKDAVGSRELKTGAAGSQEIKKGAVKEQQLAAGSVGQANIKQGAVQEQQLAAGSVGQANIKQGAVQEQQLAVGSVGQANVKPGAIGEGALAQFAVTQNALALNAVGSGNLAQGAVGQSALAQGAVGQSALAPNAVTEQKIAQDSIGAAQVKNGALVPQKFTNNGLPEVGYASREMSAVGYEAVPKFATNNGVLNLDITPNPPVNGYSSSSGVVGAVAPSRLTAVAQVVLKANVDTNLQCRLARFHDGVLDQLPFSAGTNTFAKAGNEYALPLAGGLDVEPGSYNIRVQCFTFPEADGSASFARGSLTVSIAPR